MDNHPLVSVIMPVYNRAELMGRAVRSVVSQTYERWELIIIDDGSSDGTLAVAMEWSEDERIRVLRNVTNRGANYARNRGILEARGEFINFLDSDDALHPSKVARQLETMVSEGADVCVCETVRIAGGTEAEMGPIRSSESLAYAFIAKRIRWHTMAPLWKAEFLRSCDGFNEALSSSQDYEFYARLVLREPRVAYLDEALCVKHEEPRVTDPHKIRGNGAIDGLANRIKSRRLVLKEVRHSSLGGRDRWRMIAYLSRFVLATWVWRILKRLRGLGDYKAS